MVNSNSATIHKIFKIPFTRMWQLLLGKLNVTQLNRKIVVSRCHVRSYVHGGGPRRCKSFDSKGLRHSSNNSHKIATILWIAIANTMPIPAEIIIKNIVAITGTLLRMVGAGFLPPTADCLLAHDFHEFFKLDSRDCFIHTASFGPVFRLWFRLLCGKCCIDFVGDCFDCFGWFSHDWSFRWWIVCVCLLYRRFCR